VVNVRDHRERGQGLRLTYGSGGQVSCSTLFFGFRGSRTPITAIVANLA
jgi:hypothetical protein